MRRPWPISEFAFAASLLLGASFQVLSAQDPSVSLGPPLWTNDQVQLTLHGESGVAYVIQSSADLHNWAPLVTNSDSGTARLITAEAPNHALFYRAVRGPLPLFSAALAAVGNINMKGNNLFTDSYDSSDPNYSVNGLYPFGILAKTKAGGDISTDASFIDSLSVGDAKVKGSVRTGPGTNTIVIGTYGSIGDRAWVEGGSLGIQPGHSSADFNASFPSVGIPVGSVFQPHNPDNTIISGTFYQYVFLISGSWYLPAGINGNNGNIYVGPNASVRLRIDVNVSSSSDVFRLSPTNAFLQIFVIASSFIFSGNASIDNQSGHPERFYLYGLPTCTTISLGGNGGLVGSIYAPQANFSLGGGASDTWDIIGAVVTKSVTLNGHFNFHLDENLARIGPWR
jgi:hypothetical protein